MRITIVYTNRNSYLCPAPVGALLVAQRLDEDGHEIDFVDLMHAKDPQSTLAQGIKSHRPDLVCFSIRNVDNMQMTDFHSPLPEIAGYAEVVRQHTAAPMLIGGTAVTTFPVQIRDLLGAEYAFAGDNVEDISRFVSSMAQGKPDLETPGLAYGDEKGVHQNPFVIKGYREVRFGGWERVALSKYRKGYFDSGVVTCSGCTHACSFCDAHRSFGSQYLPRDPSLVIEEMKELKYKHKAKSVFLINNGLNYPLEHGKDLLRQIIDHKLRLPFSCIIEPGPMDREFAELLYRANCNSVMIFGSSLDDAVLERNQPHYRSHHVIDIAKHLSDANVPYMLGLMFGGIGETLHSVERSLKLSLSIKPVMLITGVGFRILPDTPLQKFAIEQGFISPDDDCFQAKFYEPPDAPTTEIAKRLKAFTKAHPWHKLRMIFFVLRSIKEGIFGRSGI